jgi:hypothetical protein
MQRVAHRADSSFPNSPKISHRGFWWGWDARIRNNGVRKARSSLSFSISARLRVRFAAEASPWFQDSRD